jgi:phage shock protein E
MDFKLVISLLIFGFILVIGVLVYFYTYYSPFRISAEEAKERIKNKEFDVILDVRTDFERNTVGYYPTSVHIEGSHLEDMMPKFYPDKSIRILIYCNTGQRARHAIDILQKMGYKNTLYITSGHNSLLK